MNKLIIIAIVIIIALVWMNKKDTHAVSIQEGDEWEWADSSDCEDLGGRMIEGMGCVTGDIPDDLQFNKHLDPKLVKEQCDKSNGRYDAEKNLCMAFNQD